MSTHDIKTLNSVIGTLIDSCNGYKTCCDLSDDNHSMQSEFTRRCNDRKALVVEFQNEVKKLGGNPEDDGTAAGAVHRGFTRFVSLFQDDEKAAVSALDDGEEYLAEKIEDKLEDENLSAATKALLKKAHRSAKAGERFFDQLDD